MTLKKVSLAVIGLLVIVAICIWPKAALMGLVGLPLVGMALSADRQTQTKERGLKVYPVKASTCIYDGSLVALGSDGFAIPAANASAARVVGVARGRADNSAVATDGAINVYVESPIIARFAASSITQAMVGQMMFVVDDQTFDDAIGTYGTKAGRLVEYISSTEGWIMVREQGPGAVVANADATYGQPEADLINELKSVLNTYVQ